MSLTVAVALFVMGLAVQNISNKSFISRTEDYMTALTISAAEKASNETAKHLSVLHTLSEMEIIKNPDTPLFDKCRELTKIANTNPDYENFGYYTKDGESFTAYGQKIKLERDYITNAMKGLSTVRDPIHTEITDMLLQIYAVPVYDENKKPVGCVTANTFVEQRERKGQNQRRRRHCPGTAERICPAFQGSQGNRRCCQRIHPVQPVVCRRHEQDSGDR